MDAKSRLIAALLDLIAEHPLAEITVDDLCRESGVKKGSFHYHFALKTALTITAFDAVWESEIKPELERCFAPELPPIERFSLHLNRIIECESNPGQSGSKQRWSVIWSACTTPGQDTELASKLRDLFNRRCAYYEAAITEAVAAGAITASDARTKAVAFAALIDGLLAACRTLDDPSLVRSLRAAGMAVLYSQTPLLP